MAEHVQDSSHPLSLSLQGAAGGSQSGEQTDGGTGNWRGMIRKGDEGAAGERAGLQHSYPSSPHKGYAVNLLDVVGTPQVL